MKYIFLLVSLGYLACNMGNNHSNLKTDMEIENDSTKVSSLSKNKFSRIQRDSILIEDIINTKWKHTLAENCEDWLIFNNHNKCDDYGCELTGWRHGTYSINLDTVIVHFPSTDKGHGEPMHICDVLDEEKFFYILDSNYLKPVLTLRKINSQWNTLFWSMENTSMWYTRSNGNPPKIN